MQDRNAYSRPTCALTHNAHLTMTVNSDRQILADIILFLYGSRSSKLGGGEQNNLNIRCVIVIIQKKTDAKQDRFESDIFMGIKMILDLLYYKNLVIIKTIIKIRICN